MPMRNHIDHFCPVSQISIRCAGDLTVLSSVLEFTAVIARVCVPIAYLDKSNVRGLLSEALSADVQSILADQTSFVCAYSAIPYDQ